MGPPMITDASARAGPAAPMTSPIRVPIGTVYVPGRCTSPCTVTTLPVTGRPSAASATCESVVTLLTTTPTSVG